MSNQLASSVAASSGGFSSVAATTVATNASASLDSEHGLLLPDLNGVDLVMSLSPKSVSSINNNNNNNNTASTDDLHQHHGVGQQDQQQDQHQNLNHHLHHHLVDHHGHYHHLHHHQQHLQNNSHSTPFSVTDILSPIEESYRKLELAANPPSPYRWAIGVSCLFQDPLIEFISPPIPQIELERK